MGYRVYASVCFFIEIYLVYFVEILCTVFSFIYYFLLGVMYSCIFSSIMLTNERIALRYFEFSPLLQA
jgi:hypothetical protein